MYSGVATGIFAVRNADKTMNENIGRLPVTVGQSAALVKAAAQHDNAISKHAKTILNNIENIAKSDKVFNGISKTVKFAADHVNPLIVASSGYTVLTAEDKKSAIISETGCLAGMFIGEGWMKKNLDGILNKLPINKKWLPVVKGLLFVGGSIGSSTIGKNIGDKVAEYWDKPIATNTQNNNENFVPKSITYKA